MRISKQSAPYVDSYDLTVTKDELRLIHKVLGLAVTTNALHSGYDDVVKFHSVQLDDRKQQIWEEMTIRDKLKQMKGSIDDIKGILD